METAAQAFASAGDARKTLSLIADLHRRFPHHVPLNLAVIPSILAENELRDKHPGQALKILEEARPYDFCEFSNLAPPFVRARAYLQMHDGRHAALEFQSIIDHPGIDTTSPKHVLARLGLARALAENGDVVSGRRAYADFLADWAHADADIPELRKASTEFSQMDHRKPFRH